MKLSIWQKLIFFVRPEAIAKLIYSAVLSGES